MLYNFMHLISYELFALLLWFKKLNLPIKTERKKERNQKKTISFPVADVFDI